MDRVAAVLDETGLWRDLTELPETLAATLDARAGFSDVAAMLGAPGVKRVVASGNGAAYYVCLALWLASLEGRQGPEVLAVPSGLLARDAFAWRPGDVLLAVSSSGEFRDLIEAIDGRAPAPYAAVTSTPGSTIGSRAGACALVAVAHQRAVTHTQAFCGNVVAALGVWAKLTSDPALASALARLPEQVDDGLRASRAWAAEAGAVEAANAVVFGSGPAWAAALEAALLLKEVSGMPAEGVETREGATSTMMALRPGDLALSLPTRADDALLAEAEEACAGRGARVLRAPVPTHRGSTARGRQHLPCRRRAERLDRPRTRARRRHARVDRRLLPRRERPGVSLGLGVIGCGSVFAGPYRGMIASLAAAGRVRVSAVYDVDDRKRRGAAAHYGVDPELDRPGGRDLPPRRRRRPRPHEHERARPADESRARGGQARPGREADGDLARGGGRDRARCRGRLRDCSSARRTSCSVRRSAPSTRRCVEGEVGRLLSGRARYGWAGPDWNEWFYQPGGGSLFDLGVYNVTSLCALFGPARRVTAMVGVAIPERVVNGRVVQVEAEDNAQVLLDFGESRFASVTTGFTMQKYRSPAIELYGSEGTIQLLGDDWAPEGWELWRNEDASWRRYPESDPHWQWTEGLRHLVDCVESGSTDDHPARARLPRARDHARRAGGRA